MLTNDEDHDASNYKYHSAGVVALSSGRFAVIGHHTNEFGRQVIGVFSDLPALHAFLTEFQREPTRPPKYETTGTELLKSLGLSRKVAKTSTQAFLNLKGSQDG